MEIVFFQQGFILLAWTIFSFLVLANLSKVLVSPPLLLVLSFLLVFSSAKKCQGEKGLEGDIPKRPAMDLAGCLPYSILLYASTLTLRNNHQGMIL
jgi:hypothetical protein